MRDGHLYGELIDILNHGSQGDAAVAGNDAGHCDGGRGFVGGRGDGDCGRGGGAIDQQAWFSLCGACLRATLGVSLLCGCWNGLLVGGFRVQPIVATLILMVAGRGVAQLITDGQIITFTEPRLVYIGNGHLLGLPFPILLSLGMLGITVLLTRKTAIGLFIESVGDNQTASTYAGVNARTGEISRLYVLRAVRGAGGIGGGIEHQMRGRQSRRFVSGTGRDSGGGGGRDFADGRTILSGRGHRGRAVHPDADDDDVHAQRQRGHRARARRRWRFWWSACCNRRRCGRMAADFSGRRPA